MARKSKPHPCLPWISPAPASKTTAISEWSLCGGTVLYSCCHFCSPKHYHSFSLGYKRLSSGLPSRCSKSFQHGGFDNHFTLLGNISPQQTVVRELPAAFPMTCTCSMTWPNLFLAVYYNLPFTCSTYPGFCSSCKRVMLAFAWDTDRLGFSLPHSDLPELIPYRIYLNYHFADIFFFVAQIIIWHYLLFFVYSYRYLCSYWSSNVPRVRAGWFLSFYIQVTLTLHGI